MSAQAHNEREFRVFSDTSVLLAAGATGWFKLQGASGFCAFVAVRIAVSLAFAVYARRSLGDFFASPVSDVYLSGIGPQLAAFVMVWCLVATMRG